MPVSGLLKKNTLSPALCITTIPVFSTLMAEIAFSAGLAITIPGILSGAWTILKVAYDLYGSVDLRRSQIGVLLERAKDLITQIAQHLSRGEEGSLSPNMQEHVNELTRICKGLKELLDKLKLKGFLWCMMHTNQIDTDITDIQHQLTNAFEIFNFACHLDRDNFQGEMRRAQQNDQLELIKKLGDLSSYDEKILNAVQTQGGRIEELLQAVLKYVKGHDSNESPEMNFLRTTGSLLQQKSKKQPQGLSQDWVITSFEVEFDATFSEAVGQGSFGKVFIGQWNAARVAVKQMHTDDARVLTDDHRKRMYKEVKIWTKLHHPNILNLYGACLEASLPFLVMQYCSFGNVRSYIQKNPDESKLDLCHDIIAGMSYLHKQNIIHADLKGTNILVDDQHKAVVSDFGLSSTIDEIRTSSGSRATGPRGTLRWMAPECLDGHPATKASDIYSLGLTIWEIFKGENPFPTIADRLLVSHVVDRQRRPDRPSLLVEDVVWELVQKCWDPIPDFRPSMTSVQKLLAPYSTRLGAETKLYSSQPLSLPTGQTTNTVSIWQVSNENRSNENRSNENRSNENRSNKNRSNENRSNENHSNENRSNENRSNKSYSDESRSLKDCSVHSVASSNVVRQQPSIAPRVEGRWDKYSRTQEPTSTSTSYFTPESSRNKAYQSRVVKDKTDLGIQPTYKLNPDKFKF